MRLDAALRHEDAIIGLRSDPNNPLDPRIERRRNDGIDYNMSYVFMKRVFLCSVERKYPEAIRRLQSYQSGWVYRPDELVTAWQAKQLARPKWP